MESQNKYLLHTNKLLAKWSKFMLNVTCCQSIPQSCGTFTQYPKFPINLVFMSQNNRVQLLLHVKLKNHKPLKIISSTQGRQ